MRDRAENADTQIKLVWDDLTVESKQPAISVVIPTHNRAGLLPRAIESVLSQLETDDELIIIDDGSTDNTPDIVAPYGQKVRYLRTENGGAGAARNRGIQLASKQFLAFLDSDDEWMPGHVLLLRSFMMARPDLLFSFTNYAKRFKNGSIRRFSLESQTGRRPDWSEVIGPSQPISAYMKLPPGIEDCLCFEGENLYRSLCNTSYVSVDTVIVRRLEAGGALHFSEDTATAEEWEFGARLARAGKSAYLHCETTMVHQHAGEQLTDLDPFDLATSRLAIMSRIWGADEEFLRVHGEFFRERLRVEHLVRIERFLLHGQSHEAHHELAQVHHPPRIYWLLAILPGWLTKGILDFRRTIKSWLKVQNPKSLTEDND